MKILVGYDDAEVSWEALVVAIIQAKAFKCKIIVFTSLEEGADVSKMDLIAAETNLKRAREHAADNKVECETELSQSNLQPGENIIQYAKANNVAQIVVGIKRRSKVGKFIFGSNARYVILEAPCPVLTVS
ncbi:MAG: universal stress protein [Deltaproteobacteria bacterium]|nr:universal stress protein [Deltaproteobacteria bacterium]